MTGRPDPQPPRLATRLLERFGGIRGAYMLGDLNEEYVRFVVHRKRPILAKLWYWRQVLRSLPRAVLSPEPLLRETPGLRPTTDLRFALRIAVRSIIRVPRFSLTVVLILGLGVGVGSSVFALVDVLLLQAPPHIEDPERVRRFLLHENHDQFGAFTSTSLAWIDYEALRTSTHTLDAVAAYWRTSRSLGRGAGARRISVSNVTPSFFPLLGVQPALGRFFRPEEDVLGVSPAPCVVSDVFWRQELQENELAPGAELLVGSVTCTVVGVTPPGFSGAELGAVDVWIPLRIGAGEGFGGQTLWTTDRAHWIRIVGRLGTGVSSVAADEDATNAYRGFTDRRRDPELKGAAEWRSIMPGRSSVRESVVSTSTMLLAGGAILILLIVVNLVNLFVVRDLGRARETAVRLALGSSGWRLFRSRVLEACLLGLAAGGAGLLVTAWLGPVVRATLARGFEFTTPALNLRVALVTLGIAFGIGVIIAAASSFRVRRLDPSALLQSAGSARSGGGRGGRLFRLGLVGVQAALSVALLVASFAFVMSFRRAAGTDLGFDRRDVTVATVPLDDAGYSLLEQQDFYRTLWEELRETPGVVSASLGYMTPWWNNRNENISLPGRDSVPIDPAFGAPAFDAVTPDYLITMGLSLRRGRWLSERDRDGNTPVVVINEALWDLYWPDEDPIGECMHIGEEPTPCREVVGVVANHRFTGALDADGVAAYFLPLAQSAQYEVLPKLFVKRISGAGSVDVRQFVQTAAPDLPAALVVSVEDLFDGLLAPWRLGSFAFTGLGVLAMIVGTFGLFSILSYLVEDRRREFAIRAAIGATASQVAVPVVWQGVTTVGLGLVAGFGIVWGASEFFDPLLFRTQIGEPVLLGAAALLSLIVAVFATLAPARDAAARDPMETLRVE